MQIKPALYHVLAKSPPIPHGFELEDFHFVYIMKKFGSGGQGAVYLAYIQPKPFTSAPETESYPLPA